MMVGTAKIAEGLLALSLNARKFRASSRLACSSPASTRGRSRAKRPSRRSPNEFVPTTGCASSFAPRPRARSCQRSAPSTVAKPSAKLDRYLEDFGHQVYDLDFAEPTQIEAPTPVLMGLKALVLAPRSSRAKQAELTARQEKLIADTRARCGPLRRRVFDKSLGWAQRAGPYREEALFYMGAAWPTLRAIACQLGARFVEAGVFRAADDIYYLRAAELETLVSAERSGEQSAALREELRADRRAAPTARCP